MDRTILIEGALRFDFIGTQASQYDKWSFYKQHFQNTFGGAKAVDFIYLSERCVWLIEAKDFRLEPVSKERYIALAETIAFKVRDTLAGLVVASFYAQVDKESSMALSAMAKNELRVVLHLDTPTAASKLFRGRGVHFDLSLKLKQKLRGIGHEPLVVNMADSKSVEWEVTPIMM